MTLSFHNRDYLSCTLKKNGGQKLNYKKHTKKSIPCFSKDQSSHLQYKAYSLCYIKGDMKSQIDIVNKS